MEEKKVLKPKVERPVAAPPPEEGAQEPTEDQDKPTGISEEIDDKGRTVLTVDVFEKETFEFKYNGKYIIDRIEVRHQDLWAKLANQSKNAVGLESNITDAAQEIVRGRPGQNIQVKHILAMVKNEGVDPEGRFPELNDEEKMMLNIKAAKGVDMMQVYSDMPEVLNRLVIGYPKDLKLADAEAWGHFDPGLGKELFDRCMSLLMTKFTIKKGFQKK